MNEYVEELYEENGKIFILRRDGCRHGENPFDKTQGTIKSTITFLLQDVRSAKDPCDCMVTYVMSQLRIRDRLEMDESGMAGSYS